MAWVRAPALLPSLGLARRGERDRWPSQEGRAGRRPGPAVVLLILMLSALWAACAAPPRPAARSELLRGVLASTVQILAERTGGGRRAASGVVVAADPAGDCTFVLTAGHFVAPPVPET